MKRDEYIKLIRDISDPYSVWIRDKEIKREKRELKIPSDYTLYLDGDGDIDPGLQDALIEYGAFENGFDFIYTDEDETDKKGRRHDPFFKPDHSPDTLDSFYYPGGLTIVKNSLVSRISKVSSQKEESLEFLRECGKAAAKPLHIPEVLYHAGSHHGYGYKDESEKTDSTLLPENVAVVILSKDHPELLKTCVTGLFRAGSEESVGIECVVLDNGSSEENTLRYEALSKEFGFSYVREERSFVFSALCNKGAGLTGSPLLLFLNDDIEVPEHTRFLKKMMAEALKTSTGAVGCRLLYPDGRIQHIGISLLKSGGSHCFSGYRDDVSYHRNVNRIKRNVFAVTGACLMVERKKFEEAGGFDEDLAIAYTDTDLCAALICKGYYNVCLNSVFLIHHESLSRKADGAEKEKFIRLKEERSFFYKKYSDILIGGDPWYNKNLTGTGLDMGVDVPGTEERIPFYDLSSLGKAEKSVKGAEKAGDGQILYNIEGVELLNNDAAGHEDFLDIRGWGFLHGKRGYEYDILVVVHNADRDYVLETGRILREDLPAVFPKERDILLSGFEVKAAAEAFGDIEGIKISLVFKGKDIFGRDRSYIINES